MKKFFKGFQEFAMRGNMLDLAVGVIIGAAFKSIVDSLVSDILSPVIGLLTGRNFADNVLQLGEVRIGYGAFLTAILNFLIVAFVLYLIVTAVNRARNIHLVKPKTEEPAAPTTKVCPYCKSEIAIEATRCPHCTSQLE